MKVLAMEMVPKLKTNPGRSVTTRKESVETRNSAEATTRLFRRPMRSPTNPVGTSPTRTMAACTLPMSPTAVYERPLTSTRNRT
jgi:hypothetical protein